jgi:hypothetical protein
MRLTAALLAFVGVSLILAGIFIASKPAAIALGGIASRVS